MSSNLYDATIACMGSPTRHASVDKSSLTPPINTLAGPSQPFVDVNPFKPIHSPSQPWDGFTPVKTCAITSPIPIPAPSYGLKVPHIEDVYEEYGFSLMMTDPKPVTVTFGKPSLAAMPKHVLLNNANAVDVSTRWGVPRSASSYALSPSEIGSGRQKLTGKQERDQAPKELPRMEDLEIKPFDSPDDGVVDVNSSAEKSPAPKRCKTEWPGSALKMGWKRQYPTDDEDGLVDSPDADNGYTTDSDEEEQ